MVQAMYGLQIWNTLKGEINMPKIVPDGVVELYSHFDIDPHAGIQIKFEDAEEQSDYFTAHRVASKVDCSYMRKSRALRLEI